MYTPKFLKLNQSAYTVLGFLMGVAVLDYPILLGDRGYLWTLEQYLQASVKSLANFMPFVTYVMMLIAMGLVPLVLLVFLSWKVFGSTKGDVVKFARRYFTALVITVVGQVVVFWVM